MKMKLSSMRHVAVWQNDDAQSTQFQFHVNLLNLIYVLGALVCVCDACDTPVPVYQWRACARARANEFKSQF